MVSKKLFYIKEGWFNLPDNFNGTCGEMVYVHLVHILISTVATVLSAATNLFMIPRKTSYLLKVLILIGLVLPALQLVISKIWIIDLMKMQMLLATMRKP